MVHLVDHQVGRRLDNRALVTAPLFWIGLRPVDDGPSLAIHTNGLGKHARALAITHVEGVELAHEVSLHGGRPLFVGCARHLDSLHGFAAEA